jgi:hypothetical protein
MFFMTSHPSHVIICFPLSKKIEFCKPFLVSQDNFDIPRNTNPYGEMEQWYFVASMMGYKCCGTIVIEFHKNNSDTNNMHGDTSTHWLVPATTHRF